MSIDTFGRKSGNKSIRMQYPYDSSGKNRMFDGTIHDIIPIEIMPININGQEFFVMIYYDLTMSTIATTLLIRIGNILAKVPLDDYDFFIEYLENNNIMSNTRLTSPTSTIIFQDNQLIQLAQSISIRDLLTPNPSLNYQKEKPIFRFNDYVPLSPNGTGEVMGGLFSISYIKIEPYTDEEDYVFNKEPNFEIKDREVKNGIYNFYRSGGLNNKHRFCIEVKEGTTAQVFSVDSEGRVSMQLVLLIPGIHEYTITYASCKYENDYEASRYANTMVIKAKWPEYEDRHDIDNAFYDGCRRNLTIEFYNANGKRINDIKNEYKRRRF